VLFETCAAVTLVLMVRLVWGFFFHHEGPPAQLTAQAARMLEYWALLLYVHGLGLVWFRRAETARAALLGLAGLLYLGCGFVFSLLLGSLLDWYVAAEDLRTLAWEVGLPIVAWMSALLGVALLIRALMEPRDQPPSGNGPRPADQPQSPAATGPLACRGFVALVAASLLLALVATVVILVSAGRLLSMWYFKASTDRSVDFLGVVAYGSVYLVTAMVTLTAALLSGRRALRQGHPNLLWLAGLLAVIGGLQHPVIIGWPALLAGVWALRAAHRSRPPRGGAKGDKSNYRPLRQENGEDDGR